MFQQGCFVRYGNVSALVQPDDRLSLACSRDALDVCAVADRLRWDRAPVALDARTGHPDADPDRRATEDAYQRPDPTELLAPTLKPI